MSEINNLLSLYDYQSTYDSYSSANVKLYLNDFYLIDAVSISYDLVNNKTPIYPYNSEHFSSVAPGTSIVYGSLGVVYTETAYFELLRQKVIKHIKEAKTNIAKLNEDGLVNSDTIYGMPIKSYYVKKIPTTTSSTMSMSIYGNELIEVVKPTDVSNDDATLSISPYVRNKTIEDYMAQSLKYSEFEDLAERLEDQIWNSPNAIKYDENDLLTSEQRGFAVWDPYGQRIRNELEMDYTLLKTGDEYIHDIMAGDDGAFNLYVMYGDTNIPQAEHTHEVINDVHFQKRSIVINNDGMPVIALYTFFGSTINRNMSHYVSNLAETLV